MELPAQKATQKAQEEIVREGLRLFWRETATWIATDSLVSRHRPLLDSVDAYLTINTDSGYSAIFYRMNPDAEVLLTISFNRDVSPLSYAENTTYRRPTSEELKLIEVRNATFRELNQNSKRFTRFANANFNIIPFAEDGEKYSYVLTAPTIDSIVLFGNDYLLEFDDELKLKKWRGLHQNLIPVEYENPEMESYISMHTHGKGTSKYITATDVCTLLLYQRFTPWQRHMVFSKKFVSIWECDENALSIIKSKTLEKILDSE